MTDRKLLEKIIDKIEAMDNRIEAMDNRIGQLVRHVAEVRQSNIGLEAAMHEMRADIRALDKKIETRTDFLVSKINHFVEHLSMEQTRARTRFEEEQHLRSYTQARTDQRLDAIEQRLEHLEAASS